jgi:hypothetical protein
MKSISEIKKLISSDDVDVIELCQKFIDERSDLERLRGEAAERRANIILSTLGASSAFLVFIASIFLGKQFAGWPITILYTGSVLWLARSVWYCIKSIHTQNRFRLTDGVVFEVQGKSKIDTLKIILSGKIWELQRSIQPNTERLFYVQRAQRALIVSVGIMLILGGLVISRDLFSLQFNPYVLTTISVIGAVFWFFGDYFIEKAGIWKHD